MPSPGFRQLLSSLRTWPLSGRQFRVRFLTKILGGMVVLALIPMLAALVVSGVVLKDREEKSSRERLTSLNGALADDIVRTVGYTTEALQSLASTSVVGGRAVSFEEKTSELKDARASSRLLEDLTLLDLKGRVLASSAYLYRGEWTVRDVFSEAEMDPGFRTGS